MGIVDPYTLPPDLPVPQDDGRADHLSGLAIPALVLAHRLYDDPSWDADIVARNDVVHPGFVPGGVDLQVLSNGQ